MQLVCIAYHAKQGHGFLLVIYHPVGIKYFVATMFRVCLRKHHQLDIGWISLQLDKVFYQIVDLIIRQCQAELIIGHRQGNVATFQYIHGSQGLCFTMGKYLFCDTVKIGHHRLGHAVMQQGLDRFHLSMAQRMTTPGFEIVNDAALDTLDCRQRAMLRNFGSLGRPGRYCAKTWHHQNAV